MEKITMAWILLLMYGFMWGVKVYASNLIASATRLAEAEIWMMLVYMFDLLSGGVLLVLLGVLILIVSEL